LTKDAKLFYIRRVRSNSSIAWR